MQNEANFVPARRAVFVSPAIRRRFQGGRELFVRSPDLTDGPSLGPRRWAERGFPGYTEFDGVFGPLEMAEESRFLVRSIARSRTFKPLWHMLL